ncbi:trimeric intracellular cation channel family protein [Roseovarius sp. D22-M7]|uniref:trimeric intracellular cation channel family protein n=1 Tax=Roseovarius sp. D22-M7 TaxID=3127116 RepID=UPI00300FB76C
MTTPFALDLVAVLIFALTGALSASRAQLDIVGFLFLACLTAMGGGTARDLLLDRNPVFWLDTPAYVGVACAAALVVFFTAHLLESRARGLLWLDAAALAIATSAGVAIAADVDRSPVVLVIMGVLTGTLGGLLRDVVTREVPLVLRAGELYVAAAFAGALAGVASMQVTPDPILPALIGAGTTFALRAGSLAFGWRLPVYRARPPRS